MTESITIFEGKPVGFRSLLTKEDGVTSLLQADVFTITARLYDLRSNTPYTLISTEDLTVSEVIFDTLQTGGWSKAGGYNFYWIASGTDLTRGGGHYLWDIEFVGVSSDNNNRIVAEFHVTDLMSQ